MAKRLDQVLVIDIESTCWDGGYPPKGQANDIIEIGLCPLELSTGRRLEKRSILVRPERSVVSPFCTQLTTLTQEQVAGGIAFKDACKLLEDEYLSQVRLWASFGDYDRKQFDKQCRETGVRYPFGPSHLNVKTLCSISRGLQSEVGLPQAIALFGLTLEGTHHRGHDDAWNIAAVLWELLKKSRGKG
ncbi:MAG TPA: 3'-5' exonuclease [Urbifossiella sp.]|jgi:inhibitor of KinA sporulation pathway (predicted exonuclease)|nr:3'-5' exonuclease [Urbifossiella sp.]